jgi:hypothetical protein
MDVFEREIAAYHSAPGPSGARFGSQTSAIHGPAGHGLFY